MRLSQLGTSSREPGRAKSAVSGHEQAAEQPTHGTLTDSGARPAETPGERLEMRRSDNALDVKRWPEGRHVDI